MAVPASDPAGGAIRHEGGPEHHAGDAHRMLRETAAPSRICAEAPANAARNETRTPLTENSAAYQPHGRICPDALADNTHKSRASSGVCGAAKGSHPSVRAVHAVAGSDPNETVLAFPISPRGLRPRRRGRRRAVLCARPQPIAARRVPRAARPMDRERRAHVVTSMNRPGCYQPERQLLGGIRTR